MQSNRSLTPSTLSIKDLPWQILWQKETCTLCGKCTAVCPVQAIELGVFRKRTVQTALNLTESATNVFQIYHGIRQKTDPAYSCIGCAMCSMVCPNDAIIPAKVTKSTNSDFTPIVVGSPGDGEGDVTPRRACSTRSSLFEFPCSPTRPWMPVVMNLTFGLFWGVFCHPKKT